MNKDKYFNKFLNFDNFQNKAVNNQTIINEEVKLNPNNNNDLNKSLTYEIKQILKNRISEKKYSVFFQNSFSVYSLEEKSITFSVATDFIRRMIEANFINDIYNAVNQILGENLSINFKLLNMKKDNETLKNSNPSFKINEKQIESPVKDIQYSVGSKYLSHIKYQDKTNIDVDKRFENYIVGQSNNMAYAIAKAVSDNPGVTYPQVYIYGNSGLGKTHLLNAICNEIQENKPHLKICLTTANAFMSEMILAIQNKTDSLFRKKYSDDVDVLIIDDIHELKDKTRTQTEFFHIFNDLQKKGKQLLFTSDKSPREINGIEERIRTRLSSALLVEIFQPDLETRIAILKKKSLEKDIFIEDEVIDFIARCIKNNVRELEGSLIKLGAYSDLMQISIDLEIAKDQLGISSEYSASIITIKNITNKISLFFKLNIGDIIGKSRKKEITFARHIAMYFSHRLTNETLENIGNFFSNRDHTSVIHAVKKIERLSKEDQALKQQLYEIENLIIN